MKEFKSDHVACRDLSFYDVLIKCSASFTTDAAGPYPGAGVSQLHLCELSRAADLLERIGGEVGEVALREAFASSTIDDRTEGSMDGVGSPRCAKHGSRLVNELRVEIDVRAPDLRLARHAYKHTPLHGQTIHITEGQPPLWRRLDVAADTRLDRLHDVIQTSMGWTDTHLHMFSTATGDYGVPDPELGFRNERNTQVGQFLKQQGDRISYTYDFGDG